MGGQLDVRCFTTAGTGTITRDQRFVVAANHQVILEVGNVGADRVVGIEAPQVLAGSVGEQVEEVLEVGTLERAFQVFDDVELDVALAQDVQRAA